MVAAGGTGSGATAKAAGYSGAGKAVKFFARDLACQDLVHHLPDSLQFVRRKGSTAAAAVGRDAHPTVVGRRLVLSARSPQNGVVSRTPRFDLRRGVVDPVVPTVSRREVEANAVGSVVQRLEEQFRLPTVMWRYRGQMALVVDGRVGLDCPEWQPGGLCDRLMATGSG